MRFADSRILVYLIFLVAGLVLFCAWAEMRYRAIAARFAKEKTLTRIAPSFSARKRFVRIALTVATVIFAGLALARPQWGTYWKEKEGSGLDIVIALDVSKSMLAQDVRPDRISFAKQEIRDFVKGLKGDRVGLIAFSGDAFLYCPLTMDYNGFFLALDTVTAGSITKGGTSISGAIEEALRTFTWAAAEEKVLVLITDGEETEGDIRKSVAEVEEGAAMNRAFLDVARSRLDVGYAGRRGRYRIFCLGIGSPEGGVIPYIDEKGKKEFLKDKEGRVVRSRLDEKTLQEIASRTGGIYLRAIPGRPTLEEIYEKGLSKLKKRAEEETIAKSYKERFQYPLAVALLLLLSEMVITLANKNEKI